MDQKEDKKKGGKRLRWRRRTFIYSLLVIFATLSLTDLYLELVGLPAWVENQIEKKIRERGIILHLTNIRCGLVVGLLAEGVSIYDSQLPDWPLFTAEEIKASFSFGNAPGEVFGLDDFAVSGGNLKLPLFPESGKEGSEDFLAVSNIEASLSRNAETLAVDYLSGKLQTMLIKAEGRIENLLLPAVPIVPSVPTKTPASFSVIPLITRQPRENRCQIYHSLQKLAADSRGFPAPKCRISFLFDAKNHTRNQVLMRLDIPHLSYGHLQDLSGHGQLLFAKQHISLEKFRISPGNDQYLEITGIFDPVTDSLKGKIKGQLEWNTVRPFIADKDQGLTAQFSIEKPLTFQAEIGNFIPSARELNGHLKVSIPEMSYRNCLFSEINAELAVINQMIIGKNLTAKTDQDCELSGKFCVAPLSKSFNANLNLVGNPGILAKLMPEKEGKCLQNIIKSFRLPEKLADTAINADIQGYWGPNPNFMLSSDVVMNNFAYNGVDFRYGAAKIYLEPSFQLIMPAVILEREEGRAALALVYEYREKRFFDVSSPFLHPSPHVSDRLLIDFDSTLAGDAFLQCILPGHQVEDFDFSNPIPIKGSGLIDYLHPENTTFISTLSNAHCRWNGIPLEKLQAELNYRKQKLVVKKIRADLCSGKIQADYQHDFTTDKGHIKVDLQEANFTEFTKHLDWQQKDSPGTISGKIDAELAFSPDGKDLMHGNGNLAVRNADIWEIPVLYGLAKVLKEVRFLSGKWGQITSLDADFELLGNKLHTDSLRTDGSVVSLEGQGNYFLHSKDFDFKIRGKILHKTPAIDLITAILDPFSWFFESRVYRQDGKIYWEKISSVKRFFKQKEKIKDK